MKNGRCRAIGTLVVGIVACGAATPGRGSAIPDPRPPASDTLGEVVAGELGRRMDAVVSAAEAIGYSGQVLVALAGRPVLHKAYGFAHAGERRRMQLDTPVGIASVSKQFAAAAVLHLEGRGLLSREDSLTAFFDEVPEEKRGITVLHLITHTSGLRSRYSEDFEPATREALVDGILETPAAFPPGERWQYSAAGYNLLASIVERVTGIPYEEAVRQLLLEPARMGSTGFLSALPSGTTPIAHAYLAWEDRGSPANWPHNQRNFGAGDMVSTAADLFRWELSLREGHVLGGAASEDFYRPLTEIRDGTWYGFGLFHQAGPDGGRVIEHGGDAALGFNGSFLRYPDEEILIIVTCNARTAQGQFLRHAIGEELEALAREGTVEGPTPARLPDPATIDRLTGAYRIDGGGGLALLTDGAHLWIAAGDPDAAALLRPSDSDAAADFERAEAKTQALLQGLHTGDSTAFHTALTTEGMVHFPGYWQDWEALIAGWGPFREFRVLGSRPVGGDVLTTARLRFFRGTVLVTYFWQDRARGRLVGAFIGGSEFGSAVALPLAAIERAAHEESEDVLQARDPMRGTTLFEVVPISDDDGGPLRLLLRLPDGDVMATRSGLAGWVPPLR